MIYITGDTHRQFDRIERFCHDANTTKNDVLIILGDVGINYYGGDSDREVKRYLQTLPITFFCIHGNHENRPENLPDLYHLEMFHNNWAFVEKEFPNIYFAMDGGVYNFNGCECIVIGGAWSADKEIRLFRGWKWYSDEQPSPETRVYVGNVLDFRDNKIDILLTHTCPLKYEPVDMFLNGVDQAKADKSTETWFDELEEKVDYKRWYCGHWHTDRIVDKINFMFNGIEEFPTRSELCSEDIK